MFQIRYVIVFSLTVAMFLTLASSFACGGGDDEGNGDGGDGGEESPAATSPADEDGGDGGDSTFDVTLTDNVFDPDTFSVPAGSDVTFNLSNEGAGIHNMRIAGEDNQFNTDDDATSDLIINVGATSTVEWTAPDEPGEIDFQCDYHLPDMAGTITVE